MTLKLALVASALVVAGSAATAKTRLLVNCFWPSSHFACSEVLPNWIDEVERVTEGRVTGIIPPKSVAPPPEQLAAVEKGIADVSVMFNGFFGDGVQGPRVAMQPFVAIRGAETMSRALWATNRKYFPDEVSTVHLLSQFVISPGELYSQTDTPITTLEGSGQPQDVGAARAACRDHQGAGHRRRRNPGGEIQRDHFARALSMAISGLIRRRWRRSSSCPTPSRRRDCHSRSTRPPSRFLPTATNGPRSRPRINRRS